MIIIAPFVTALFLGLALTPVARRLAIRYDLMDRPVERSSHTKPTPFGGGHPIFAATWRGTSPAPSTSRNVVTLYPLNSPSPGT